MSGDTSRYPGNGFVEGIANAVDPPVADAPVMFPNLSSWATGGQDSAGWIDVRGLGNLVVLVTANTQDATVTIKSKRTLTDPAPADLAAAANVIAGNTSAAYDSTLTRIGYVQVLVRYTSSDGGTADVSLLAE